MGHWLYPRDIALVAVLVQLLPFAVEAAPVTAAAAARRDAGGRGTTAQEDNNDGYLTHSFNGGIPSDEEGSDPERFYEHFQDFNEIDGEKIDTVSRYLSRMLIQPWSSLPIVYVEYGDEPSYDFSTDDDELEPEENDLNPVEEAAGATFANFDKRPAHFIPRTHQGIALPINSTKRSRYYRKYPWKRQNSKQTYDAENRYLCQPSRDDVFRLLVALHKARRGSRGHTVNFCNRKRPASAIFTNIRFLGK